jgi:predicted ATPase/DNA-binding SARP family transcriptional activator
VDLGSPKQRAVLGLLALHAGHAVRPDKIIEFVWADSPPPSAASAVHTYVRGIRRALHSDGSPRRRDWVLRLTGGGYRLDAEDVDLLEFRRAVAAARHAGQAGWGEEARARLRDGVGLWQGRPLADLGVVQRAHPLVAGLEQEYLNAVVALADAEMEAGSAAVVLPRLHAAAAWAPWHEPMQLRLVRAYQMAGQRAEALRVYERVRRRLREELGVDPGVELREAFAGLLAADAAEAGMGGGGGSTAGRRWLGKRPEAEALIGRDADLAALRGLLGSGRVVTLVGAGGVGKTALGLRLAEQVAEGYRDGVAVVQLGMLAPEPAGSCTGSFSESGHGSPREGAWGCGEVAADAVAELLGVRPRGAETTLGTVAGLLRGLQLLLVLDNAEHVCASAARLVDQLVRLCPSLRVLVTSRRRLGVAGETVWEVPTLPPPAPGASERELRESPAARLFLDRAARRCPGYDLGGQWQLVGQLCRDLEGLPLAIELAAARLGSLSLADLAARMFQQPALLADTAPHRLPHQRSLAATLSWSLRLLPDDARDTLIGLSVFASSFSLATAEAMADPHAEEEGEGGRENSGGRPLAERLAELVDVSLVQARPVAEGMSYRILVPVREVVLHATAPCELRRARARQLRMCTSLARPFRDPGPHADDQMVTWVAAHSDDFAAAVRWALQAGDDAEHDLTADLLLDSI